MEQFEILDSPLRVTVGHCGGVPWDGTTFTVCLIAQPFHSGDNTKKTRLGNAIRKYMYVLSYVCMYFQTYNFKYKYKQGGITCGAIDEPRKSSKAIVIARFRDKNGGFILFTYVCIY